MPAQSDIYASPAIAKKIAKSAGAKKASQITVTMRGVNETRQFVSGLYSAQNRSSKSNVRFG